MVSEEELKKAIIDIMKDSNDLESAKTIFEAVAIDNYYITAGRVNIVKVAMKCILEYLNTPRNLNITETRREMVKLKEIEKTHKEENGKLRVYLTKQDKMIHEAYAKANNYLYFNDSSDYEAGLWEVIRSLRPDLAEKWDNGDCEPLKYIEEESE